MTTDTTSTVVERTNRYLETTTLRESAHAVVTGVRLTGGVFCGILAVAAMCMTVSALVHQTAVVHPGLTAVAGLVFGGVGYKSADGTITGATTE